MNPDAPITNLDEDVLARAGFARDVASLAADTPSHWTVRIGVYGPWGTGKTSVLNLVSHFLESAGHLVARFNPWGFADSKAMLGALAETMIKRLKDEDIAVAGGVRRTVRRVSGALRRAATRTGDAAAAGSALVPYAAPVAAASALAGFASGWVHRLFSDYEAEFGRIEQALQPNQRLVVLIDDVDRADPNVLRPLLFALHEVLAHARMAFVLALDPVLVGAALAGYHPGFGNGLQFLEKIIQFPCWLPQPTPADRLALALHDIRRDLAFVDETAVRQEIDALPTNPRVLRQFLRGLWQLRSQVPRYDPDEIDWNLLLTLGLVREEDREALGILLADQKLLVRFAVSSAFDSVRDRVQRDLRERLGSASHNPTEHRIQRGIDVLRKLARSFGWSGSVIRTHARMFDDPPLLTGREYRALVSNAALAELAERAFWDRIVDAVDDRELVASSTGFATRLRFDALQCALTAHEKAMNLSADASHEESVDELLADAQRHVRVLASLLRATDLPVPATVFGAVCAQFRKWAHFSRTDAYRDLHTWERSLLIQVAALDTVDHAEFLGVLGPWQYEGDSHPEAASLRAEVVELLEERVARTLPAVFARKGGVSAVLSSSRASERWILFRPSFWSEQQIVALRLEASTRPAVAENALSMFEAIASRGSRIPLGMQAEALASLAANKPLMHALWELGTARAVNVRMFSGIRRARENIEAAIGENLPTPPWWQRVSAELEAPSASDEEDGIGSGDEEVTSAGDDDHAIIAVTTGRA